MEQYHNGMGRKYWDDQKSLNPHKVESTKTTTIEVTKEVVEYLKKFDGGNFTERIGSLDWKQNCAKATTDSCGRKADGALRLFIAPDLMVALPLCDEHMKKSKVENMKHIYEDDKDE